MMDILIQNATMVLPETTVIGDLLIADGIISQIQPGGGIETNENTRTIDATGLHLLPGIIDPQVHFRDPGQPEKEDLYTGSCAAASGGVTSFLDMPNNVPSQTTLQSMHEKIETGNQRCVTNFGFFIGATESNVEELQKAVGTPDAPIAIPGICGIKIFMGSSTGDLLVNESNALEEIFTNTAGLIAVHAEDETRMDERKKLIEGRTDMAAHAEWRDDITALIATKRAVGYAQATGHRLHILHLTSGIEADYLSDLTSLHGAEGEAHITTEVLPQHLTLDESDVEVLGTRLKMNPPIRYKKDKETLWKRLHDGTIACIATDHAPHTLESKAKGFPSAPSGMPGVETSLPVMLTHASRGACTIEQVVKWMASNVAEIYGMIGKGRLEEGYDGDITLVDMTTERMVDDANTWTTVRWNPFHGKKLVGWPTLTVVGGVPVFERNEATGPKGSILVEEGETGSPLVMTPWN
jgi:dihydroorotase